MDNKMMQNNDSKQAKALAELVQTKHKHIDQIKTSDYVDRVLAHPILGLLIFAFVMLVVFTISQVFVGPTISDWMVFGMDYIAQLIAEWLSVLNTSDFLSALVLEGMIGGLSAVLGFLPLIMVLFFLLHLLEDSGYMARVALLMDRYFKKIGLAGRSIIPMFVGTACSIPAVMAARTIKNRRQRMLTVMLTPFVPCGAKLPVIALFVSVFFTTHVYLTALIYILALGVIFLSGWLIKYVLDVEIENDTTQLLIIELPQYKRPSLKQAFHVMIEQAWDFVRKAATIIVLMNTMIWMLSHFNFAFNLVESPSESMLYSISQPFAWLMIPLGFGVWGLAAAAIAGFVAKEEVIGALAIIFVFSINDDFSISNLETTRNALTTLGGLTSVSAFSYMAFNLFTPPCFAAIGAMSTELNSRKWTIFAVLFQFMVGYSVAMIIYQIGTLMIYRQVGDGFVVSIVLLITLISMLMSIKFVLSKRRVIHG
jgi:ferrous iron transport protein B